MTPTSPVTAPTATALTVTTPATQAAFDRRMLEALVCPRSEAPLRYDAEGQELICDNARLAFPIRDGIPIMLVSKARVLP